MKTELTRCPWCLSDPLNVRYHDEEWGVPVRQSRDLFAKLILDGAQAGLSWLTILKKRDGYYRAFEAFDPEKMARFDRSRIESLLSDPGIVRNRLKVEAAIQNARAYLALEENGHDFSEFLWKFVDGVPIRNRWKTLEEVPATSAESLEMSRELRAEGFKFVGPTICYAFMQAVGMVNDHLLDCYRRNQMR